METKSCKQCNNVYSVGSLRGRICKSCNNLNWREKYKEDKQFADSIKQKEKNYARQKRKEALQVYGGKCACCGESQFEFLTFDHIHGRTEDERFKKGSNAYTFLKWLADNNYPSTIQVLCYNCNCSKGHHKQCPHTLKSQDLNRNIKEIFDGFDDL